MLVENQAQLMEAVTLSGLLAGLTTDRPRTTSFEYCAAVVAVAVIRLHTVSELADLGLTHSKACREPFAQPDQVALYGAPRIAASVSIITALFQAFSYYKAYQIVDFIGEETMETLHDLKATVELQVHEASEEVSWGLTWMFRATMIYFLWMLAQSAYFSFQDRRRKTMEVKVRRKNPRWPSPDAHPTTDEALAESSDWRATLKRITGNASGRDGVRPASRPGTGSAYPEFSGPGWQGPYFGDWRGVLQRQLGTVPEEVMREPEEALVTMNVEGALKNLPAVMPLQDREILQTMLVLIDSALVSIIILCFTFDHAEIYNALVRAKNRGVFISFVADGAQMLRAGSSCKRQKMVFRNMLEWRYAGLSVILYTPPRAGRYAVQHQKVLIIDKVVGLYGSANFTHNSLDCCAEFSVCTRADSVVTRLIRIHEGLAAVGQVLTLESITTALAEQEVQRGKSVDALRASSVGRDDVRPARRPDIGSAAERWASDGPRTRHYKKTNAVTGCPWPGMAMVEKDESAKLVPKMLVDKVVMPHGASSSSQDRPAKDEQSRGMKAASVAKKKPMQTGLF